MKKVNLLIVLYFVAAFVLASLVSCSTGTVRTFKKEEQNKYFKFTTLTTYKGNEVIAYDSLKTTLNDSIIFKITWSQTEQ